MQRVRPEGEAPRMTFHATENVTKDLPADFESDCLNCDWFLKHYEREDLFLFQSVFEGGWHIINRYKAEQKPHASGCGCGYEEETRSGTG